MLKYYLYFNTNVKIILFLDLTKDSQISVRISVDIVIKVKKEVLISIKYTQFTNVFFFVKYSLKDLYLLQILFVSTLF